MVADYDVVDAASAGLSVSRAVWIGNVFDRTALHDDDADAAAGRLFFAQLESDFVSECSRFGPIARRSNASGASDDGDLF